MKPARSRRTLAALPSPSKRPQAPKPCAQNTTSRVAAGATSGAFTTGDLRVGERAVELFRPRSSCGPPSESDAMPVLPP